MDHSTRLQRVKAEHYRSRFSWLEIEYAATYFDCPNKFRKFMKVASLQHCSLSETLSMWLFARRS